MFTDAISVPKAISGAGTVGLTLSGNSNSGVLMVVAGTTLDVSGLTISSGSATDGGAIDNFGNLNIDDATFSGNSATNGGAIDNENGGTLTVLNSTFSNNLATTGGAIDNSAGGTATITDSTIADNSATTGGGIANSGHTHDRERDDREQRCATGGAGGGLYAFATGTAALYDTIVALNTDSGDSTPDDIAGAVSGSYNLVDDAPSSGGLSVDPPYNNLIGVSAGSDRLPVWPTTEAPHRRSPWKMAARRSITGPRRSPA